MKFFIIFSALLLTACADYADEHIQGDSDDLITLNCPQFFINLNAKTAALLKERDTVASNLDLLIKATKSLLDSSTVKNKTSPAAINRTLSEIRDNFTNFTLKPLTLQSTCVSHGKSIALQCLGLAHQETTITRFIDNLEHFSELLGKSLNDIQAIAALARSEGAATTSGREYSKWKDYTNEVKRSVKLLQTYFDAFEDDIESKTKVSESLERLFNKIECIDDTDRKNPAGVTPLLVSDSFAINTTTLLYENFLIKFTDAGNETAFVGLAAYVTSQFPQTSLICRCGHGEFHANRTADDFNAIASYYREADNFIDAWASTNRCINIANDAQAVVRSRTCWADDNGALEYGVFCRFHEAVVGEFYKDARVFDVVGKV